MIPTRCVKDRAHYMRGNIDAGFEVISYYFESDLASALERNSYCEAKANIPEVGLRAIYKKLEIPNLDEDCDQVFKLKIAGNGEFITL